MSHQLTWLSNLPSLLLLKYIGLYICSSLTGVSNKEDFHWRQWPIAVLLNTFASPSPFAFLPFAHFSPQPLLSGFANTHAQTAEMYAFQVI